MAHYNFVAVPLVVGGQKKPSRARKPTLARALRQAAKAGVNVAGATIEDGKVSLTFSEAQPEQTNDLDKWMAKRHAH